MSITGLEEYAKTYSNPNTQNYTRGGVRAFLEIIFGDVRTGKKVRDVEIINRFDELSIKYLSEPNDPFKDLVRFSASLSTKAPKTARGNLQATLGWLEYNEIVLSKKQLSTVKGKLPKGGTQTREDICDVVTLRKILNHADLKTKSMVLCLASSGMRLNEILSLKLSDVQLGDVGEVSCVRIPGNITKTGNPRTTFFSSECTEILRQWLAIREDYTRSARNKANGLNGARPDTIETDERIFPMSDNNAIFAWNNCLAKSGLQSKDSVTGWSSRHLHTLRKFFRSQLALKIPTDVVEELLGHSGYLTGEYRVYSERQLKDEYQKGESVLTVLSSGDVSEIREQLDATSKDLAVTRQGSERTASALSGVVLENQELKGQLETMRLEIKQIQESQALIKHERDAIRATGKDFVRADDVERMVREAVAAALKK
jgi:integrase